LRPTREMRDASAMFTFLIRAQHTGKAQRV
jgi:hypothetical protein